MLTSPPLTKMPRFPDHPSRSHQNSLVLTQKLLAAIGEMIEVASFGTGVMPHELAVWAGTALIRWSERDLAHWQELNRRTRDGVAADEKTDCLCGK